MGAGCVAESSAAGWRAKWRWCARKWKISPCQATPRRFPGASGDRDAHHDSDIVWPGGATSAHLAHRESLANRPKREPQTLDAAPSRPVVVIADGAQWIKKEQARHFPQATCILDWAHLWREVRQAIQTAARAKLLSRRERDYQLYVHRSWLWHGGVDQAVQALRTLGTGLPAEPLETIKKAITYLEHQRGWIGSYEHWRKQGYPVGSGMIERAVSLVINRRMKKRGMRWCRPNATAIVALRTDLLNEDWILPQRLRSFP